MAEKVTQNPEDDTKPLAVFCAWTRSLYVKYKHFAEACIQRTEAT